MISYFSKKIQLLRNSINNPKWRKNKTLEISIVTAVIIGLPLVMNGIMIPPSKTKTHESRKHSESIVERVFREADTNTDGKLSEREVFDYEILRRIGFDEFDKCDYDASGYLGLAELENYFKSHRQGNHK